MWMTNTSVCSVLMLLEYKLAKNAKTLVHQTLSDLLLCHHHYLKALNADLDR